MIAYFDCYAGISGNMVLGAMIDAGLSVDKLKAGLAKLSIAGYTLSAEAVNLKGFRGTQVSVKVAEDKHQHHRRLSDILRLIDQSSLSDGVKKKAAAVFRRLAEAEAAVHGTSLEDVHFHEVGATDAIVDIVGVAIGLDEMEIERVYASPVPTGYGMVQSAHGPIPVPGPAVLELLRKTAASVYPGQIEAELTTPTGAAILATLAIFDSPRMSVKAVGYGFGQRDYPWPNALRIWLGEPVAGLQEDKVCIVEANIDDATPEILGAAMDELLAGGALDVYFTPIQMKKNRPATKLSIIAPVALRSHLAKLVMRSTTSLGVRTYEADRLICQRWQDTVESPWGPVRIKVKAFGDRRSASPEFEDCLRIAREHNVPIGDVYEVVRLALTSLYP